jgi:hypothetical protein
VALESRQKCQGFLTGRAVPKRYALVGTLAAYSSVLALKSRQKCQDFANQGHGVLTVRVCENFGCVFFCLGSGVKTTEDSGSRTRVIPRERAVGAARL